MAAKTRKKTTSAKPKAKAQAKKKKSLLKTKASKQTKKPKMKARAIDFKFYAPLSKKVSIGGSFNKWKSMPLKGSKSGVWSKSLKLKTGRHEYRFNIDGRWENDNQRETELAGNGFGETNNVLTIR